MGWVTTNLGRNGRLAEIAATAATDAAELGKGFNSSAEAARIAWADAANRSTNDHLEVAARRETLAFIAWIPLTFAWLWPIVTVVLAMATPVDLGTKLFVWDSSDVRHFDFAMAVLGVIAIPVFALFAVELGHSARANIKGTDRRGGSIAMVALTLGYLTLIAWPIWIIGVVIAAIGSSVDIGF